MYFSGSTLHLRIWTDFVICRLEPAWLDLVQIFMSDEGDCNKLNTAASFFELLSCEFRGLLLVFRDTTEDDEFWTRRGGTLGPVQRLIGLPFYNGLAAAKESCVTWNFIHLQHMEVPTTSCIDSAVRDRSVHLVVLPIRRINVNTTWMGFLHWFLSLWDGSFHWVHRCKLEHSR